MARIRMTDLEKFSRELTDFKLRIESVLKLTVEEYYESENINDFKHCNSLKELHGKLCETVTYIEETFL